MGNVGFGIDFFRKSGSSTHLKEIFFSWGDSLRGELYHSDILVVIGSIPIAFYATTMLSFRMASLSGFIYSVPSEYRKFFSFPFPKSNVCICPVDPLRRPDSVSSDTIPISACSSVNVLFRHTACLQSESLLVLVDREPWNRACDSDSGGAHLNYRINTDIGLFLLHERTFFVVFIIYRIVVCTIIQ